MSMTRSKREVEVVELDDGAPDTVAIGWRGMMLPFTIVVAAIIVTGRDSVAQLVMVLSLLAIPGAILMIRRRRRQLAPA